jgi:Flp pilus assembly pilin Flp
MSLLRVRVGSWLAVLEGGSIARFARRLRSGRMLARETGQTTAEYALVLLAAAAVAFVLIAWAQSSDKLPDFFDSIIDDITGGF